MNRILKKNIKSLKILFYFILFFSPVLLVNNNFQNRLNISKFNKLDYHSLNNPYNISIELIEYAKRIPANSVVLNDPYGKYPLNIYYPLYLTTQVPFASSKDQIARNYVLEGVYPLYSGEYHSRTINILFNLLKKHSISYILIEPRTYDFAKYVLHKNPNIFIVDFENPIKKELVLKLNNSKEGFNNE